jgi:type III restriction enzyme
LEQAWVSGHTTVLHAEAAIDRVSTRDAWRSHWVAGVNHLGTYGRWALSEFTEVYQIEGDLKAKVVAELDTMSATAIRS